MDFIWKGLLALLWLVLVPAAAGALFFRKKDLALPADRFLAGYLFLFSLAEVLILLMMYLKLPLHLLVLCYGGIAGLAAVCGAVRTLRVHFRRDASGIGADGADARDVNRMRDFLRGSSVYFWGALLLIAFQIAVLILYAHFDADDALYVATATTAVETDSIFRINAYTGMAYRMLPSRYILSPFPIFLAVVSQLSGGLHPAIMAHTVLPPIFLICVYVTMYCLARKWFPGDRRAQELFLFLTAVLFWFSAYSVYNAGDFQMVRLWQGKAVLAAFLLPTVFYLCSRILLERQRSLPWVLLLMANLACCLLSSMGIILAPLSMGIFSVLGLLFHRSPRRMLCGLLCCLPSIALGLIYIRL